MTLITFFFFLGDWNENRSSLNIETLNYSFQGAKILDSIGLPVFFVVGNHDLYRRHSREIYSVVPYQELTNFQIISEPTVIPDIGNGGALICPYMFESEYPSLKKYTNLETWWGHFEFKGFVITGYSITMPSGPDILDFRGPKHIFSGHFHKRQANDQVCYIGNCFPMDFGDAGDNDRGMMVYSHDDNKETFINWPDCPRYVKTTLSALLDNTVELLPNSHVKCTIDIIITFEESTALRSSLMEKYKLREFILEESPELSAALSDTTTEVDWENMKLKSVDELVVDMLNDVDTTHVQSDLLVEIYRGLQTDAA